MKPYRSTPSARLIAAAAAVALAGGGVTALTGSYGALALFLCATLSLSLTGFLLGVYDHVAEVVTLGVLLPMALLPFAMLAIWAASSAPWVGWIFLAAALATFALALLGPVGVPSVAVAPAPPLREAGHTA
jgi:hypothetical protein